MRRFVLIGAVLVTLAISSACEDGPNQTFSPVGDNARDRGANLCPIVDHLERKLTELADDQHLVAGFLEHTTAAVEQRLAVEQRKRLRRAEPAARAADQQNAGQRTTRHCSL